MGDRESSVLPDENRVAARATQMADIKARVQARREAAATSQSSVVDGGVGDDRGGDAPTPSALDDKNANDKATKLADYKKKYEATKAKQASRKAADAAQKAEAGASAPLASPACSPARDEQPSSLIEAVRLGANQPAPPVNQKAQASTTNNQKPVRNLGFDKSLSQEKHSRNSGRNGSNQGRGESIPRAMAQASGSVNQNRCESIPRALLPAAPHSQPAGVKIKAKFKNQKERDAASSIAENLRIMRKILDKNRKELDKKTAAFAKANRNMFEKSKLAVVISGNEPLSARGNLKYLLSSFEEVKEEPLSSSSDDHCRPFGAGGVVRRAKPFLIDQGKLFGTAI
jgi:hypothetical protein